MEIERIIATNENVARINARKKPRKMVRIRSCLHGRYLRDVNLVAPHHTIKYVFYTYVRRTGSHGSSSVAAAAATAGNASRDVRKWTQTRKPLRLNRINPCAAPKGRSCGCTRATQCQSHVLYSKAKSSDDCSSDFVYIILYEATAA